MAARRAVLVAACLVLCCFSGPAAATSFCDSAGYSRVFEEDFATLNASVWTKTIGYEAGQGRAAYLTADNVYVEDGALVLRSTNTSADLDPNGTNFTSGAVTTQGSKFWKHMRVCVTAKLPGSSGHGDGVWPAHWMMPEDKFCWPDGGEIDIMEMINGDGVTHGTYHWSGKYPPHNCTTDNQAVTGQRDVGADWATAWHEYAMEWSVDASGAEFIDFAVDGVVYSHVVKGAAGKDVFFPPGPMYLILNTAIDGPWPRPVDKSTRFPVYHRIDHVVVSQRSQSS